MQTRKTKKTRQKRSSVWLTATDAEFSYLVASSSHIGDVLKFFGLENVGRNHHTARDRIAHLKLSTAHFNVKARAYSKPVPTATLLVEGSNYSRHSLKKRLLKEGLLLEACSLCGCGPEWRGKKLTLVLDHINGVRNDNRLENLRMLCPNCNSQGDTFSGRNNKKVIPS